MKPIYKTKGKAKEYGELSINIYTGCNHGCVYCYAPSVLKKTREVFEDIKPRENIIEATRLQLESGSYKGKKIHLCFTCDPYPADIDTATSREIIKLIKDAGAYVQILTKGGNRALRDFDLLDTNDWFGVTITEYVGKDKQLEPNAASTIERLNTLELAKARGLNTWVSFEPVYNPNLVYEWIKNIKCVDLFKIGKLNYAPSDIDWKAFGHECERLCKEYNRQYYIKEDLRAEMNKK